MESGEEGKTIFDLARRDKATGGRACTSNTRRHLRGMHNAFKHNPESLLLQEAMRKAERKMDEQGKHGPVRIIMKDGKMVNDAS